MTTTPEHKHSPFPWSGEDWHITDALGETVAEVGDSRPSPVARLDVDLIVQCVNAHDELVGALKEMLGEINFMRLSPPLAVMDRARAALAKAGK